MPTYSRLQMINGMRAAATASGRSHIFMKEYEAYRSASDTPMASSRAIVREFGTWTYAEMFGGLGMSEKVVPGEPLEHLRDPRESAYVQDAADKMMPSLLEDLDGLEPADQRFSVERLVGAAEELTDPRRRAVYDEVIERLERHLAGAAN